MRLRSLSSTFGAALIAGFLAVDQAEAQIEISELKPLKALTPEAPPMYPMDDIPIKKPALNVTFDRAAHTIVFTVPPKNWGDRFSALGNMSERHLIAIYFGDRDDRVCPRLDMLEEPYHVPGEPDSSGTQTTILEDGSTHVKLVLVHSMYFDLIQRAGCAIADRHELLERIETDSSPTPGIS